MRKETNTISHVVKDFDCNMQKIVDYDVLKHREDFIKKLKKESATKAEFAERLNRNFMSMFWSRAEYELIVRLTDEGRVLLLPWCGCCIPDEDVALDVTDDASFDWKKFAEYHIGKQIYKNEAKIDVYAQLQFVWDELVTYLWTTKLKWERSNPKFHD